MKFRIAPAKRYSHELRGRVEDFTSILTIRRRNPRPGSDAAHGEARAESRTRSSGGTMIISAPAALEHQSTRGSPAAPHQDQPPQPPQQPAAAPARCEPGTATACSSALGLPPPARSAPSLASSISSSEATAAGIRFGNRSASPSPTLFSLSFASSARRCRGRSLPQAGSDSLAPKPAPSTPRLPPSSG